LFKHKGEHIMPSKKVRDLTDIRNGSD